MFELDSTNASEKNKIWEKKISWFLTPPGRSHPHPYFSAQGALIQNRPDSVKTMPMVTLYAKFEVSAMIR